MEERQKIIDNILEITHNNNKIEIKNIILNFGVNKYSSTKTNIWHIELNNNNLSRRDKYIFKYKCVTCSAEHSIETIQFLRKIIKGSICCYLCRNKNETKRLKHSELMKGNINSKGKPPKLPEPIIIKTPIQLKEESLLLFNTYNENFKNNYFNFHLTESDYKRISKNLISLQDSKFNKIIDYDYWPIFMVNNQMEFSSVMYDKNTNTIFKANNPILKCDICKENWRAKSLEKFKNNVKIMCKECSLVNKTFKIRTTHNCHNKQILYQSKLELKFINWCNDKNIVITNGPKIPYVFKNKNRIYKVDFQIKDILIEIKDDHVWHQNDIKSGKWEAKENAAKKLIELNEYSDYYLIKPNNWNEYLDKINKI